MNGQTIEARDTFGDHYRLVAANDASVPAAAKPLEFNDRVYARQFLAAFDVPPTKWLELLYSVHSGPPVDPYDRNPIDLVATLIVHRRLSVYKVPCPHKLARLGLQTVFLQGATTALRVMPPVAIPSSASTKPCNTFEEAMALLQALDPEPAQLKAMSQLAGRNHWSPAQPRRSIARELLEGNLVVAEQSVIPAAPPAKGDAMLDALAEPVSPALAHTQIPGVEVEAVQLADEPVCEFDRLTLRCNHFGDRGYILDALHAEPNVNGTDKVIQVLTQDDADADEVNIAFGGYCGKGSSDCPAVSIRGPDTDITTGQSPYKLRVVPPDSTQEVNTFTDFIRNHLIPNFGALGHNSYTITTKGCDGIESAEAIVHAFPTWKWQGKAAMGFTPPDGESSEDTNAGWSLGVGLAGNIGTQHWNLESSSANDLRDYFPELYDTVKPMIDRLSSFREEGEGKRLTHFDVKWPSVELAGGVELQEVQRSHRIDVGGTVALSLSPLLGANVKIDILGWLIRFAATGYSRFLEDIRARAEEGIGNERVDASAVVRIDLEISGELAGKLEWNKVAGKPWNSKDADAGVSGGGSASLTVALRAKIQAETRVFYVKVTVGMAMSVASASSESEGVGAVFNLSATTQGGKPALSGCVEFTGAAIYYTYYAEVSREGLASDDDVGGGRRRRGNFLRADEVSVRESNLKKLVDVLPSARYPKNEYGYKLDEMDY